MRSGPASCGREHGKRRLRADQATRPFSCGRCGRLRSKPFESRSWTDRKKPVATAQCGRGRRLAVGTTVMPRSLDPPRSVGRDSCASRVTASGTSVIRDASPTCRRGAASAGCCFALVPAITVVSFGWHAASPRVLSRRRASRQARQPNWRAPAAKGLCNQVVQSSAAARRAINCTRLD